MSNIVKKETSGIIPKEIANITLEELMSTEGVEFHKKNNILRMKQRIANEIVTVEVRSYDDTNIISQSRTNKSRPVSQMESTIAQLRKEGRTQTEVANLLGTTQTNISKIEKKMKNRKKFQRNHTALVILQISM